MKVVCDNCRAVYKVPNDKLTKPVNKATCRSCGHRMLIPRARPGADPDERTLVTAVPPTPIGAPPRPEDRATTPLEDDREATIPGPSVRDDVQVFSSTPLPTSRDTVPGDLEEPEKTGPGTAWIQHPAKDDGRSTLPSQPASRASGPVPVGIQSQAQRGPGGRTPISPPGRQPAAVPEKRSGQGGTPGPAPGRSPTPGPAPGRSGPVPGHDPFWDLLWSLAGTIGALVGTLLLSSLSVFQHWVVLWAGLLLAFGGCATAILILLTSQLGRRPAWTTASVVLGTVIAFTAAAGLTGAQVIGVKVVEEGIEGINFAAVKFPGSSTAPSPEPAAAPAPVVQPEVAAAPEPLPEPAVEPVGEEPVADAAEPVVAPEPAVAARPTPGPAPEPTPGPAPVAAPRPAPPPPPPPAPAPVAVSYEVVDILLRNNIAVKRCFVPLAQAGAMPKRVDVRFTLATTGKATGIAIVVPTDLGGSDFERCMAAAIAGIEFPAGGPSQKVTYPFQLQ